MKTFIILALIIFTACSCKVIKDPSISPLSLNQHRVEMKLDNETFVGIAGTINRLQDIEIRTINSGDIIIAGEGDCGYITGFGFKDNDSIKFNMGELPDREVCIYRIHVRLNDFDAPAGGILLIRQFTDPNITPLKIKVNNETRYGWGAVALKAEAPLTPYKDNIFVDSGILESTIIEAYPDSRTGQVVISSDSCKFQLNEYYDLPENTPWKINIRKLYENIGSISTSCLFDINFNNDHALKNSASVLVSVYKEPRQFLPAPVVFKKYGKICFEFQDPYVIGVVVNDEKSSVNSNKKCVSEAKTYVVEGYTSVYRFFYGIYDNNLKKWTVMK